MTTIAIKNNIYKALENIEDPKFLKAVYEIVSSKADSTDFYELTDEQKAILDERDLEYKQGKGKYHSWEEAKKIIRSKKNVA